MFSPLLVWLRASRIDAPKAIGRVPGLRSAASGACRAICGQPEPVHTRGNASAIPLPVLSRWKPPSQVIPPFNAGSMLGELKDYPRAERAKGRAEEMGEALRVEVHRAPTSLLELGLTCDRVLMPEGGGSR